MSFLSAFESGSILSSNGIEKIIGGLISTNNSSTELTAVIGSAIHLNNNSSNLATVIGSAINLNNNSSNLATVIDSAINLNNNSSNLATVIGSVLSTSSLISSNSSLLSTVGSLITTNNNSPALNSVISGLISTNNNSTALNSVISGLISLNNSSTALASIISSAISTNNTALLTNAPLISTINSLITASPSGAIWGKKTVPAVASVAFVGGITMTSPSTFAQIDLTGLVVGGTYMLFWSPILSGAVGTIQQFRVSVNGTFYTFLGAGINFGSFSINVPVVVPSSGKVAIIISVISTTGTLVSYLASASTLFYQRVA